MPKKNKKRYHAIKSYSLSIFFVAVICMPLTDNLFHIAPKVSQVENRNLQQLPAFSVKGLLDAGYFRDFEKYFNDNFGFRKNFIRLNSLIGLKWINIEPVNDVVVGKKGWLFFSGEGAMSEYMSRRQLNTVQLLTIKHNLEGQKKWLQDRGIYFLVVVVPDKHSVYPEFLPDGMRKMAKESDLGQLSKYLKDNSDIDLLDLRESLLDAKSNGCLYHPTDTHWNSLGVFYGYSEVAKYLSKRFPAIKAKSISDFRINQQESKGMDIANLLALSDKFSDVNVEMVPLIKNATVVYEDKPAFTYITEVKNPSLPRIVILGDSFGETLWPLLSEHASRLYFTKWLGGYYRSKRALIEKEKPDIVILETVERYVKNL